MLSNDADSALSSRISMLERRQRRLTVVCLALATSLAAGILCAWKLPEGDRLKVKQLEIVNDAGLPVITLGTEKGAGVISVYQDVELSRDLPARYLLLTGHSMAFYCTKDETTMSLDGGVWDNNPSITLGRDQPTAGSTIVLGAGAKPATVALTSAAPELSHTTLVVKPNEALVLSDKNGSVTAKYP